MTVGDSKAAMMITQPALVSSPQSRPAPTRRALPPNPAAQRGQKLEADEFERRLTFFQPLGKQSALTAVIANDKARHQIPPPNHRRIISLRVVFTQSGPEADIEA